VLIESLYVLFGKIINIYQHVLMLATYASAGADKLSAISTKSASYQHLSASYQHRS